MGHLLGYARASTAEQNAELQTDELTAAGCWRVYVEHASGALDRRPQLDVVLEQLRPGDTLVVVWRLDRLGRLGRSLRESIDTTTAGGRLVSHLFGALAQFEREIIRDRTVAGLAAARARVRVGGRPSKLSAEQRRQARRMHDARELTVEQIGQVLGVSRTSIYRVLGQDGGRKRPEAEDEDRPGDGSAGEVPYPGRSGCRSAVGRGSGAAGRAPVGRASGAGAVTSRRPGPGQLFLLPAFDGATGPTGPSATPATAARRSRSGDQRQRGVGAAQAGLAGPARWAAAGRRGR